MTKIKDEVFFQLYNDKIFTPFAYKHYKEDKGSITIISLIKVTCSIIVVVIEDLTTPW
jgi:hypothetical protein